MANKYEVHTQSHGAHHVHTPHHHDDYSESDFKKLLGQAIQGAVSGISNAGTTIIVTRFILKKL